MDFNAAGLCPLDDEGKLIWPYDEKLGSSVLAGDPPPDTVEGRGWARERARWLSYNAFRARLLARGADNDLYWPVAIVCGYLEPLARPEEEWRARYECPSFPRELGMETGMAWLRIAGAQMYACDEFWGAERRGWAAGASGHGRRAWRCACGYYPTRWACWKEVLRALVNGEKGEWRPNVVNAAKVSSELI